ncbi:MAG TPA: L,D-transpeptidase family protein [Longimicrobium sp.]|nr:L,D-transpeptidase family protein [Longimicrobium sp.]
MRALLPFGCVFLLGTSCVPPLAAVRAEAYAPLQAVVVTTADWDATDGTLRRYERDRPGAEWRAVGGEVRVAVGRTGLAWGRGLHPETDSGPQKREGDGRAPAGIFPLSSAFGYAPAAAMSWVRLPYHHADDDRSLECVDDPGSRVYNRLVDRDTVRNADWRSHEEMRRPDELYRLGVWVDHNTDPVYPGSGSCIFLHLWQGPGVPTVGCTAMAPADLEALVAWLDPRARPVLVQLPASEAERGRGWGFPLADGRAD